MARYIAPNNRKIQINEWDRFNDQVILSGIDESYPVEKGIFFLEFVEATTGTTVIIKDGLGNTIVSGVDSWSQDHSPIRCDYGIEIEGNLKLAKGFFRANVFSE